MEINLSLNASFASADWEIQKIQTLPMAINPIADKNVHSQVDEQKHRARWIAPCFSWNLYNGETTNHSSTVVPEETVSVRCVAIIITLVRLATKTLFRFSEKVSSIKNPNSRNNLFEENPRTRKHFFLVSIPLLNLGYAGFYDPRSQDDNLSYHRYLPYIAYPNENTYIGKH